MKSTKEIIEESKKRIKQQEKDIKEAEEFLKKVTENVENFWLLDNKHKCIYRSKDRF